MDYVAVRAHLAELNARELELAYRRQWDEVRRLERLERAATAARGRLSAAIYRPLRAGQ